MAYTPNPTDATQPVDTVFANTAAAEFRALKAYIAGIVAGDITLGNSSRNQLNNPGFQVNQRGLGVVTTHNEFFADRWRLQNAVTPRINAERYFGAIDQGTGVQLTVTASGAPAAGDLHGVSQILDGRDWLYNKFGTVNAAGLTLSFDVRSSVPGTYSYSLRNAPVTRSYVGTFTINQANVWERKTVTIPGDTAGAWATGDVAAVNFWVTVGCGTTFQTATLNAWQAGNFVAASTATQFASQVNGSTMQIVNLQLESGSVATPWDSLPYALETLRCQRYFRRMGPQAMGRWTTVAAPTGVARLRTALVPSMRAAPTLSLTGTAFQVEDWGFTVNNVTGASQVPTLLSPDFLDTSFSFTGGVNGSTGLGGIAYFNSAVLNVDAEMI